MTPAYGILLLIFGLVVTVGFFGILFWAMHDSPQTKIKEEDNAVTRFWKRYNSN